MAPFVAVATAMEDDGGSSSSSCDDSGDDCKNVEGKMGPWGREQRERVARALQVRRKQQVLALHTTHSRHYVDHFYSFVAGNMVIVCWVVGGLYHSRPCQQPLAGFLVVLGGLALFPACLPVLLRQWLYLHVRLNWASMGLLAGSAVFYTWLALGQSWAFRCSPATCDEELCTAANSCAFVLYASSLLYGAKVAWYLAYRVRFFYSTLCGSCLRDPFPNAMRVDEQQLAQLHDMVTPTDVRLSVGS